MNQDNLYAVSRLYLRSMDVRINPATLKKEIFSHPLYPSLLSFTDALDKWEIPFEAIRLNKEGTQLKDIEIPFIAHLNSGNGRFILVREVRDGKVLFSDETSLHGEFSEDIFRQQWDGIVLYIAPEQTYREKSYLLSIVEHYFKQSRWLLLASLLILCALYGLRSGLDPTYYIELGLLSAGVFVSILLLIHSVDRNNPLVYKICHFGGQSTCNSVLDTRAAKVFSWLSWSEVGFFYYTGCWLLLYMLSSLFPVIAWINLLALPYTIYSLSYQYRHQSWCVMCCSIQFLLIIQFIVSLGYGFNMWPSWELFRRLPESVSFSNLVSLIFCFALPAIAWFIVRPWIERAQQAESLRSQLNRLKYNPDLFETMLNNQPSHVINGQLKPLCLGNPSGSLRLTIVSNPFCNPCSRAHELIETLIKERRDVQVNLLFATNGDERDPGVMVAQHLLRIQDENQDKLKEALRAWYGMESKSYDSLSRQYPVAGTRSFIEELRLQKSWSESNGVRGKPTWFINGKMLPDIYNWTEIRLLLN